MWDELGPARCRADVRMDICVDACIGICIGICTGIFIHMRVDVCIHMVPQTCAMAPVRPRPGVLATHVRTHVQ